MINLVKYFFYILILSVAYRLQWISTYVMLNTQFSSLRLLLACFVSFANERNYFSEEGP